MHHREPLLPSNAKRGPTCGYFTTAGSELLWRQKGLLRPTIVVIVYHMTCCCCCCCCCCCWFSSPLGPSPLFVERKSSNEEEASDDALCNVATTHTSCGVWDAFVRARLRVPTHVCKSCVSYIELAVTTILALSRPNFRTISKFQITLKKGFLQLSLHSEPILFITLLIR